MVNWNAVAAVASAIAALAATATSIIVFFQVRQDAKLTRYSVGIETLLRLEEKWKLMENVRACAALEIQVGACDKSSVEVLDFFETISTLTLNDTLDRKLVWHTFYWPMATYWTSFQDFVRQTQSDEGTSTWRDYCRLLGELRELEAKESGRAVAEIGPSQEQVGEFMAEEKSRSRLPPL